MKKYARFIFEIRFQSTTSYMAHLQRPRKYHRNGVSKF